MPQHRVYGFSRGSFRPNVFLFTFMGVIAFNINIYIVFLNFLITLSHEKKKPLRNVENRPRHSNPVKTLFVYTNNQTADNITTSARRDAAAFYNSKYEFIKY